jgi:hypothetical protein
MTLLLRDTDTKAPASAPEGQAPPVEAPPEVRACPKCAAPLEDGQDWCLNCGEAQTGGRRMALPGKRATATVLALTTVLVGGAVAASYAALSDGTEVTPAPTQLAQAPPAAASQAAPAPTVDPAATAQPSTPAPADTGVVPSDFDDTTTPPDSGSTPDFSEPSSSSSSSSSTTGGDTTAGSDSSSSTKTSTTDSTSTTRTSTTPTETEPVAIKLGDDPAALYDPYKRDTAAGDAKKAFDGNPDTSFPIAVASGSTQIGAGLAVDLPKLQGVREIDLTTKTPGFKIEIYATDEVDLPPDVLDTRWAHLKDVTGVGSDTDGKAIVNLGSGTTKYRHVLLWFTAPPTDGSTVRVSELKVLG